MSGLEYSHRNSSDVMVAGLVKATNLSEHEVRAIINSGRLDTIFNLHTGKIRDHLRRPGDPQAARRHLEKRADEFGFRRCSVCGDVCERPDYLCYCTRPKRGRA